MTIEQIAKELDDCANRKRCDRCTYELLKNEKEETCSRFFVRDIASECKRIVAESEDDGK